MSQCNRCGGIIAKPGMIYPEGANMCRCGWANDQFTVPHRTPTEDMGKIDPYKVPQEQIDGYMQRMKEKGNVQKPSMSHIINLCEQLSMGELRALIEVIKQLHDVQACSSSPVGLKTTTREF